MINNYIYVHKDNIWSYQIYQIFNVLIVVVDVVVVYTYINLFVYLLVLKMEMME